MASILLKFSFKIFSDFDL